MNARASQRGYVMLLVAFVVALLAIVLLAVARVQADLSPLLRRQASETENARIAQSAAAHTAFLLLTEPLGPRSLVVGAPRGEVAASMPDARSVRGLPIRELRLDGRSYAFGRDVSVAVQDEAGLLNLNAVDEALLAALLLDAGVSQRAARRLSATLADYADGDDLSRLEGAEKDDYRRAGAPDPLNRNIPSRWSAMGALGWAELPQATLDLLWPAMSTAEGANGININTAPAMVLRAALRDERSAEALIRQRELRPLTGVEEAQAASGNTSTGVGFATQPGAAFRVLVSFSVGASQRTIESQILLAGGEADRPFYWREVRQVPGAEAGRGREENMEPFPVSGLIHAP